MEVPPDILKDAFIKYPKSMCLKKTFPPDGKDSNANARENYISGRLDERNHTLTFTVSFNDNLSWDTFSIKVVAKDENEALEIALAKNPEYSNYNYYVN